MVTGSGHLSVLALDISAAFDTLDHNQILQRASDEFGLCGRIHDWLKSYLSDRSSYVFFDGFHSPATAHQAFLRGLF